MEDNRPLKFHHHQCDCTRCLLLRLVHIAYRILRSMNPINNLEITIMPKTIAVGEVAQAVLTAVDTDGKPFPLTSADTIALNASVPADVTFGTPVFNADGTASIPVTGVSADPSDVISATVDAVVSNSDTLTITPPAPKLASVTLALQ